MTWAKGQSRRVAAAAVVVAAAAVVGVETQVLRPKGDASPGIESWTTRLRESGHAARFPEKKDKNFEFSYIRFTLLYTNNTLTLRNKCSLCFECINQMSWLQKSGGWHSTEEEFPLLIQFSRVLILPLPNKQVYFGSQTLPNWSPI